MIWLLVSHGASALTCLMSITWVIRVFSEPWGWTPPPIVNRIFFNLRPFNLPAMVIVTVALIHEGDMNAADYILNAMSWVGAFLMRNDEDDDDRWKRRREKLAAKVRESGGKLVVVPVGSNA